MYHESHLRTIAKAISWRIWGTVTTAAVVWLFTKQWELALSIGALEFALKTIIFYVHERLWHVIPFGRSIQTSAEQRVTAASQRHMLNDEVTAAAIARARQSARAIQSVTGGHAKPGYAPEESSPATPNSIADFHAHELQTPSSLSTR